jgi:hypothetical protein
VCVCPFSASLSLSPSLSLTHTHSRAREVALDGASAALFSNRAACHLQQGDYGACARDSGKALALLAPHTPDNARSRLLAHTRRAAALALLADYDSGQREPCVCLSVMCVRLILRKRTLSLSHAHSHTHPLTCSHTHTHTHTLAHSRARLPRGSVARPLEHWPAERPSRGPRQTQPGGLQTRHLHPRRVM